MGMLVRICEWLSRTLLLLIGIDAIAIYVFGLGDWLLGGVRIFTFFEIETLLELLDLLLLNLFFRPGLYAQAAVRAKQALMLADDEDIRPLQWLYAKELIEEIAKLDKRSDRISAAIGIALYFFLGPRIGSPASEFIAIAIQLFLPGIIGSAFMAKLSRVSPDMFDGVFALYHLATTQVRKGKA